MNTPKIPRRTKIRNKVSVSAGIAAIDLLVTMTWNCVARINDVACILAFLKNSAHACAITVSNA